MASISMENEQLLTPEQATRDVLSSLQDDQPKPITHTGRTETSSNAGTPSSRQASTGQQPTLNRATALTVLIHGGGFDSRCWDLLIPHLAQPVIAVDLPGRGSHPADIVQVGFEECAEAVVADIVATQARRVHLVGHSLAGAVLPYVIDHLGPRVEHVVLVAATVPPPGLSVVDTLDPEIQKLARAGAGAAFAMPPEVAPLVLGPELTEDQVAWCVERVVPESPRLNLEPVQPDPLAAVRSTWIRTLRDTVVPAERQQAFAATLPLCRVVDIAAGHMCMVTRPAELANLIRHNASPGW